MDIDHQPSLPKPAETFEDRFRPKSRNYRVSQDMRTCVVSVA